MPCLVPVLKHTIINIVIFKRLKPNIIILYHDNDNNEYNDFIICVSKL